MTNIAFRLLLTFNATSLLLIVFFAQNKMDLGHFFPSCEWLAQVPKLISYLTYLSVPVFLTGLSIWLSSYLGSDEFKKGDVQSIEHANNSFLPSYLGYFFVAIGVSDWTTLWFVYVVLFIFTFLSQALYFNPLFLLFGYEFYNIKTRSGVAVFLISRHRYRRPDDVSIKEANRINNYTFIEKI